MTTTENLVDTDTSGAPEAGPPKRKNAFVRLYRGDTHFDFVGRKKWWYLLSSLVIIAGLISLGVRGLNVGIEFRGGTSWEVIAPGATVPQVQKAMSAAGLTSPIIEILGGKTVQVQADLLSLPAARAAKIKTAVQDAMARIGHISPGAVTINDIGPTWGGQVTQKALIALVAFFIGVVIYISFRFEWKMAIAALVAVMHDLLVVLGVYSLTGFQVTPDTAIAVLTILGYSLYDTVVVFDRVGENTKGLGASGKMTYEGVVNLSMNQVLARSINTSLVAILPVLSVLVIGAQLLGATTLQSFGLALVIGLASGAYSSIFIASPVLASLKEKEPRYKSIRSRLAARSDDVALLTPKQAALLMASGGAGQSARRASGTTTARRSKPSARTSSGKSANRIAPAGRDLIRPSGGKQQSSSPEGDLETENARLRAELEALRGAGAGAGGAGAGSGGSVGSRSTGQAAGDLAGGGSVDGNLADDNLADGARRSSGDASGESNGLRVNGPGQPAGPRAQSTRSDGVDAGAPGARRSNASPGGCGRQFFPRCLPFLLILRAALFVFPVGSYTALGTPVHVVCTDLHFDGLSLWADHRGMQRLVKVELRHVHVVLEASRNGSPDRVETSQRCPAVPLRPGNDPDTDQIKYVLECFTAYHHFLVY